MRALFCTRPFYGHFLPMAPTAIELQRGGHEVAFAVPDPFCPVLEAAGFVSFAAGADPRAPLQLANWGSHVLTSRVDGLVRLASRWTPNVVVREQTDFAPLVACELLGLPCATLGPALFIPPSSWRRLMGSLLDDVRAAYGLPPDPGFERLHPDLLLDIAPPWYDRAPRHGVHVRKHVRPDGFLRAAAAAPRAVESRPTRPTVYVTLGTVYNHRDDVLEAVFSALGQLDVNVICTLGPDADPANWHTRINGRIRSGSVRLERFVPQELLLPQVDVVIAHAGFGTVMGALAHGLPMLLIPLGSDNAAHAARCEALGVALSLSPRNLDPAAVRGGVERLLRGDGRRVRALELAARMATLPGPDQAARVLSELGRRETARRPRT